MKLISSRCLRRSYLPLFFGLFAVGVAFNSPSAKGADSNAATRAFKLQEASIRPDGRILRMVFVSDGVPADYATPDRAASNLDPSILSISSKAKLEYLGTVATLGDLPPIDINTPWNNTVGGKLPVGKYWVKGVVKDGSGQVVGQTQIDRIIIKKLGENPCIVQNGGQAYPFGYTSELYLSKTDGDPSTLGLYKTFTFGPTISLEGATPTGPTYDNGVHLDSDQWQNSSQAPPSYPGVTWTANYLVINDADVVTLTNAKLTVSAPAGALADMFGNKTEAFTDFSVTNESLVGANGFTDPSLSDHADDSIYIAAAEHGGADTNDGSMHKPLLTWNRLMTVLADKYRSKQAHIVVRILRGDTVTCDKSAGWSTSGTGRTTPVVVESYWDDALGKDPGTRPTIACTGEGNPFNFAAVSDVVVRGIHLLGEWNNRKVNGFGCNAPVKNLMFDDCVVEHFAYGGCFMDDTHINNAVNAHDAEFADGITFLRCVLKDNFGQGIYCHVVKNMLLSQTVLDKNGKDQDGYGSALQHNLYYSGNCEPISIWGCYVGHAPGDGTQMRSGGISSYSVYDANAIGGFVGALGGGFYKDIVSESADTVGPTGTAPKGWGFQILAGGAGYPQHLGTEMIGGEIDTCYFINMEVGTTNKNPIAIEIRITPIGNGRCLTVRHNVVFNSGRAVLWNSDAHVLPDAPGHVDVSHNYFDCGTFFTYETYFPSPSNWSWYSADFNAFSDDAKARFHEEGTGLPLLGDGDNTWSGVTHTESHSKAGPFAFRGNETTNLASYAATLKLNLSSEDDFRNYLRDRPLGVWVAAYEMQHVVQFFADQFNPDPNAARVGNN